ncbi:MAG: DEAD/DEAH box helicase [Nitrospirota bacterium]|nr:DEAD/DEAH box helicase [Nitrospirota bacterium]
MIFPENVFRVTTLRKRFGDVYLGRGVRLFQGGKVRLEEESAGQVTLFVNDGAGSMVQVTLTDGEVQSTCPCSRRSRCEHRAAAMLWLAERQRSGGVAALPWQVALHRGMGRMESAAALRSSRPWLVFRLELEDDGAPLITPERAEVTTRGLRRTPFPLVAGWTSDPLDPRPEFITADDMLLCRRLRQWPQEKGTRARSSARMAPPTGERHGLLREMAARGILYLDDAETPLTEGPSHPLAPEVTPLGDGAYRLHVGPHPGQVIAAEPPLYLAGDRIGPLLTPFSGVLMADLARRPVDIPAADMPEFAAQWLPRLTARGPVTLPPELVPKVVEGEAPVAVLTLSDGGGELLLRLEFAYGEAPPVGAGATGDPLAVVDGRPVSYRRDPQAETVLALRLATPATLGMAAPVPVELGLWALSGDDACDFLLLELPTLSAEGWRAFGEASLAEHRVYRGSGRVNTRVRSGIDWFDLEVSTDFDGTEMPAATLLAAAQAGRRYVALPDGRVARIPDWIRSHAPELEEAGLDKDGPARLTRFQMPLLTGLTGDSDLTADDRFHHAMERLRGLSGPPEAPVPAGLQATMRPYQREGLSWLEFLRSCGFHGILADDMGLGKTLQVIALLLLEKERGHATLPSLVVVPTSLIFNWVHELKRFAPSLTVAVWHGPDRYRSESELPKADLVLTNYALVRQDMDLLEGMGFHYLILDEAQYVKNPDSQVSRAVRALTARHRLALTGTPMENHLGEVWAQFAYLMPGLLGSHTHFRRRFGGPIERGDVEAAEALFARVRPFILRRTKGQVAQDLPERVETTLFCRLEGEQMALYEQVRDRLRAQVAEAIDKRGLAASRLTILDALLKLRQVCCHPELLPASVSGGITQSAKMDLFMEFVTEAIEEGHRVLVFSQFVTMLKILRRRLDAVQVPYAYLDGRTRDREARVRAFQEDASIPLFLISLKAGGTGLNLTGADYVVHFDPWWNPAVEAQATDRTHRIGQTRKVFSYKLIAEGTVEEKILALQEKKRALAGALLGEGKDLGGQLSVDDLEQILGALAS